MKHARKNRSSPVFRNEPLESRMLLSVAVGIDLLNSATSSASINLTSSPVSLDAISTIASSMPIGKSLLVPLTASSTSPLSYSVTSGNSAVTAQILTGCSYLQLGISIGGSPAGSLTFALFNTLTPNTVARITQLVNQGFYNNLTFHRIIPGFMAQGGDPTGTGSGGSGVKFDDEFTPSAIFSGTGQLAMANSGSDTNDSQFFVTFNQTRYLDYNHTIFGQLLRGWDVLNAMQAVGTSGGTPTSTVTITSASIISDTTDAVLLLQASPSATNGTSSLITVTASDGLGNSSSQSITTTLAADTTNDPPFLGAVPNRITTTNTPIDIPFNGIDPEGDSMTFAYGNISTSTGTLSLNGNILTYTPASNYTGTVSILVGVRDSNPPNNGLYYLRGSRTATSLQDIALYDIQNFNITVRATENAPVVSNVQRYVFTNKATAFTSAAFSSRFTDANSDSLKLVKITSLPSHGTLEYQGVPVQVNQELAANELATLTYIPGNGYSGSDSFGWNGFDGKAYAVSGANVNLTIGATRPVTTVGVYRSSTATFYLKNTNTPGVADIVLPYGVPGDIPVVGDWDGDGIVTFGIYRPSNSTFYLRNSNTAGYADLVINYGAANLDTPIVGDWDGNGTTTVGVYRSSTATFYIRNSNTAGYADLVINYGSPSDKPVAGDWNGDGVTTVGIYRPSNSTFYLKNSNANGYADMVINYGASSLDTPIIGDWDGDGITTVGVYRSSTAIFYLKNSNSPGFADLMLNYGASSDTPVAGVWV